MLKFKNIIWDSFNVNHIKKHKVTPDEVEEACSSKYVAFKTHNKRIVLVGKTKKSRSISVILAPKGKDTWYPITARPASKKEKKKYQETIKK